MPQLNLLTYLTQYGGTCLCFFLLFFSLVYFLLPQIKKNYFFRKKARMALPGPCAK